MEENLGGAVGCVANGRTYCAFFCAGMHAGEASLFLNITYCSYVPIENLFFFLLFLFESINVHSNMRSLCAPRIVVDRETRLSRIVKNDLNLHAKFDISAR